jgi:hypothetical protein
MLRGTTGKGILTLKAAKSLTADTYGSAVDISGYKGQAIVCVVPGAVTHDSVGVGALTVKILTGDSSGGGDATDTMATVTLDSTSTADGVKASLDLTKCDRYIRAHCDIGSHTTAFAASVALVADARGY